MRIRINFHTWTTGRFIGLLLALLVIYLLINEVTKFLQGRFPGRKSNDLIARIAYVIFLVAAMVVLLKYVLG